MASYIELRNLMNDADLRNKVTTATIIGAQGVMDDPTTFPTVTADTVLQTDRLLWAARALNSPGGEGNKILMSVLAANAALSVAQIQAASDAGIQTNVNAVLDLLAAHDKPVVTGP